MHSGSCPVCFVHCRYSQQSPSHLSCSCSYLQKEAKNKHTAISHCSLRAPPWMTHFDFQCSLSWLSCVPVIILMISGANNSGPAVCGNYSFALWVGRPTSHLFNAFGLFMISRRIFKTITFNKCSIIIVKGYTFNNKPTNQTELCAPNLSL